MVCCLVFAHLAHTQRSPARSNAIETMKCIKKGTLVLEDSQGRQVFPAGTTSTDGAVVLKVVNDNLWLRILMSHDIGCESILSSCV